MCKPDDHNYQMVTKTPYSKIDMEGYMYAIFLCPKCGDIIERYVENFRKS